MIVEALIGAVVNSLVERAVATVSSANRPGSPYHAVLDKEAAAGALAEHLRFVGKWSSEISFRDLLRSKKLAETFVDLECRLGQIAGDQPINPENSLRVSSLLNTRKHVVLLGRPGAGKTTSMQRLALSTLQRYEAGNKHIPIVLRLRELSEGETVLDHLANIISLHIQGSKPSRVAVKPSRGAGMLSNVPRVVRGERHTAMRRAISAYLDSLGALLFLDGLDECPHEKRTQAERDINALMESAINYKVVLTCRSADYTFSFPAEAYTILPLTPAEVRTFAANGLEYSRPPRL
jgi:predicted NACHT family NTPase